MSDHQKVTIGYLLLLAVYLPFHITYADAVLGRQFGPYIVFGILAGALQGIAPSPAALYAAALAAVAVVIEGIAVEVYEVQALRSHPRGSVVRREFGPLVMMAGLVVGLTFTVVTGLLTRWLMTMIRRRTIG